MRIHGYEVPQLAIDVGESAMFGEFTRVTVTNSILAHVEWARLPEGWTDESMSGEVANRLLQRERKRGTIKWMGDRWVEIKPVRASEVKS